MATVYVCQECGREYQSRSGLRRHLKSKHGKAGLPALPEAVETAGGDEGTEVTEAGALRPGSGQAGPASERSEDRPGSDRPACNAGRRVQEPWLPEGVEDVVAERACKELGIKEADVMAYKVYHEPLKVVIIEGPVGQKRVWCDGD